MKERTKKKKVWLEKVKKKKKTKIYRYKINI